MPPDPSSPLLLPPLEALSRGTYTNQPLFALRTRRDDYQEAGKPNVFMIMMSYLTHINSHRRGSARKGRSTHAGVSQGYTRWAGRSRWAQEAASSTTFGDDLDLVAAPEHHHGDADDSQGSATHAHAHADLGLVTEAAAGLGGRGRGLRSRLLQRGTTMKLRSVVISTVSQYL